jgi:hypothetical protein
MLGALSIKMAHRTARRLPSPPSDTELDRIERRLPSPPSDTELDRIARRLPSPPSDTELDRIARKLPRRKKVARKVPRRKKVARKVPRRKKVARKVPRRRKNEPMLYDLAGQNITVHGGKLSGLVGHFCYPKILIFHSSWSRLYMAVDGDYACEAYQRLRARSSVVSIPYDSYTLVLSHWIIRPEIGYYALHRKSKETNLRHAIAVVYARSTTQDPWKLYVYDTARGHWSQQEAKRLSEFVYSTARHIRNGPVLSREHAGIRVQPFLALNICGRRANKDMCFFGFCVLVRYLEALNALLPYKDRVPRLFSGEEAVNALDVVMSFMLAPQRHDMAQVADLMLERLRSALLSENLDLLYSAIYGSTQRALEAWTTRNLLGPTVSTRPLRQLTVLQGPPTAYGDPRQEEPIWGHKDQEDMAAWVTHRDHRTRRKLAHRIKPVPWTGFKGVRAMHGAFLPDRHYIPVDVSDSESDSSESDMDISPSPPRRWRRPKPEVYRTSRSYSDISPMSPKPHSIGK